MGKSQSASVQIGKRRFAVRLPKDAVEVVRAQRRHLRKLCQGVPGRLPFHLVPDGFDQFEHILARLPTLGGNSSHGERERAWSHGTFRESVRLLETIDDEFAFRTT